MEVADYSPPARPSIEQQSDALRKGLGRAYSWASGYKLRSELLLEACLTELRFEYMVEEYRGNWLWELIDAAGLVGAFRDPILTALQNLDAESPDGQLCQLARHYAERGDHAFRAALYDIVAHKPYPEECTFGEDEILSLDGETAFLYAARVRGNQNRSPEWNWDDDRLIREAAERFGGEQRIEQLLRNDSSTGAQIFLERWTQDRRPGNHVEPPVEPARSLADVLQSAATPDASTFWLRRWGMREATNVDLLAVLGIATQTDDPAIAARLLRAFSSGTSLAFDARLIDLCQHFDAEVRRMAFNALEHFRHPQVRSFAEQELGRGVSNRGVVGLFEKNYQPGDAGRILEALTLSDDPNELHWLLMSVRDVLEANPSPDSLPLALVAYAHTPCSFCRSGISRWLLGQNLAPTWLVDECCYDADDDCREAIRNPGSITSEE